jgi:hypothetical protein
MCKFNKNKISKALTLTFAALMLSVFSYAQKPLKGFQVGYKVEGRDTVYQIKLRDTYLFSWPEEKKKGRAWRDFYRLVYNFRKTYPYALIAKEKFGIADSVLNSRKFTSKQKTKYIKDFEKDLFKDFETPLRKMTISQGGLLLKLIDREIGQSSYQIIKEYRGGFNAVFWQGVARIFGSDLKKPYDKFGEDKITEDLVIMYQNGTFEDLYYSIF